MGLFFITVGLQLDAGQIVKFPLSVLFWLALTMPVKMLLALPAVWAAGLARLDAACSVLILGHGGEFGLLLIASALTAGIVPAGLGQPMLVALVLSMGVAPLLIRHHDRLAGALFRRSAPPQAPQEEERHGIRQALALRDHVVVCGAGHLGRLVAQALALADVPYLLVESDYEAFRLARQEDSNVLFGDARRLATLKAAGVYRARMVLITFHRQQPAARIARAIHHEYPHLALIATSLTDQEASHLQEIPGLRVYPEKIAAGLALAEQALLEAGLSADAEALIARLRLNLRSITKLSQRSPDGVKRNPG